MEENKDIAGEFLITLYDDGEIDIYNEFDDIGFIMLLLAVFDGSEKIHSLIKRAVMLHGDSGISYN